MALYAQHGHGKSDKITQALDDGALDGVIFGSRNESLEKLNTCIGDLREYECEILVDPQFYVSTLVPPKDGYLPKDYSVYYEPGRTAADFIGIKKNMAYASATLDLQVGLGVSQLISPSVIFDSFADRWCQIALNLADASLEHHSSLKDPPPLLLTMIFHETALASKDDLDRFLDTVTAWDVSGFYLVLVRADATYSQRFEESRLAHLMYLVHVLAERNGYKVICGYSDFVGLLLRASGASAFATGWYQSLRQFHRKSFLQRKAGGQPARDRYSSGPLMNSIFLGELQDIYEIGQLERVLSGVALDSVLTGASSPGASTWNRATSEIHHWQTLASLENALSGRARADISSIETKLQEAAVLYAQLEGEGVSFERQTNGDHHREWLRAIRQLRGLIRL